MSRKISVTVNGTTHALVVEAQHTLLEVLRGPLNLTGAKLGCDQQVCGACTVLLNDLPVSACNFLALDADGAQVLTIEGLSNGAELDPVQQAFIDEAAFQCAYCTPGMILAIKALLKQRPNATEMDVRHFLAGNICRCGCQIEILKVAQGLLQGTRG